VQADAPLAARRVTGGSNVRFSRDQWLERVGTASSRDRKAVFGAVLPASAESKVGIALDFGLSNVCATSSPKDCKVGGTVNTAVGGHRQQPLQCSRSRQRARGQQRVESSGSADGDEGSVGGTGWGDVPSERRPNCCGPARGARLQTITAPSRG